MNSSLPHNTEILIAGGGPVGLTLAIGLGQRGIRCVLVERKIEPDYLPKMELCNARSMEIYGRLGLADDIRRSGYPVEAPMDVLIVTTLNEKPLMRLPYRSSADEQAEIRKHNDGYWPREAYQRISQYTLEPLLKGVAERTPNVTVRYGCALASFVESDDGVTATVETTDGKTETICAAYLCGCDGASSTVRRQLGITLDGGSAAPPQVQVFLRSAALAHSHPLGVARHYYTANPRRATLITQDRLDTYSVHAAAEPAEEPLKLLAEVVGRDVPAEILRVGTWTPTLIVAERYATRRVFLAGDAAHQYIPSGGFGMNTGVGDAYDLTWKLEGALRGWGGPQLLASYDIERRRIGRRNRHASEAASLGVRQWRTAYRPSVHDDTDEGRAAHAELMQSIDIGQRKNHESRGIEMGYRYLDSPIIAPEDGAAPDPDNYAYEPTTWPGARLPHLWLADGTALHDGIGAGFTVLSLGGDDRDAEAIAAALRARSAPVELLVLDDKHLREIYGARLLLLRPDLHVVWRGERAPGDVARLAALATGNL